MKRAPPSILYYVLSSCSILVPEIAQVEVGFTEDMRRLKIGFRAFGETRLFLPAVPYPFSVSTDQHNSIAPHRLPMEDNTRYGKGMASVLN